MSGTDIVLMVAGMALINLAIRWPVFLFADHVRFPPVVDRALSFVPVAVLTAIIVPSILYPGEGDIQFGFQNPHLIGGIAAAVISWRWHKLMPTILVGMAAFFLARWLAG